MATATVLTLTVHAVMNNRITEVHFIFLVAKSPGTHLIFFRCPSLSTSVLLQRLACPQDLNQFPNQCNTLNAISFSSSIALHMQTVTGRKALTLEANFGYMYDLCHDLCLGFLIHKEYLTSQGSGAHKTTHTCSRASQYSAPYTG